MSASVASSETYFAPTNHLRASIWGKFEEDQKAGAIAHAKRTLNRACAVDDIEDEIATTTEIKPEYAIYEQALWMLMNAPMNNADGTFAVATAADPKAEGKARKAESGTIAPEALAWLTSGSGVELSRG